VNQALPPHPDHIETAIRDSASLHAEHETSASRLDRGISGITAVIGRPAAVVVVMLLVAIWLITSSVLSRLGVVAFDPAPFAWLQLTLAIAAVLMTVVILAGQRRAQILANRREQLMLQLAISSDHKVAKVIALLEELRRDDPQIENRPDREAAAMAKPSDPQEVVDAIEEVREEIVGAAKSADERS
jgi:uncharacterized membrane protein